MEQKLKDILNGKMDLRSLKDAMPDFDKEGTWDELSSRLAPEKRQTRPLIGWWSYAAALVGGLLIGGFAVHYLWDGMAKDIPGLSTATNAIHAMQEPNAKSSDTIALPVAHPSVAASKVVFVRKHISADVQPGMVMQKTVLPVIKVEPAPHQSRQPEPDEHVIIASAPESRKTHYPVLRAIHLLDVASEDKTVLINDAGKVHTGLSFTFYISPSRLPEGRDVQAPSSVLGHFIR